MNTRNDKKVIIATLCAIVIGMVVGYAALNQLLSINGTSQISGDFNIQITNIEENTMTNSKTISTSGLGTTTANFTVDLEKPGSSAIYNVTVENKGTIDAILTGINGIDEANAASPTDIKFSIQDLTLDEELLSKATKTFQVKVEWLVSSSTIPETSKTLNLKLNYEQKAIVSVPENALVAKINELLDTSTTYSYMGGRYLSDAQVSNYVWFNGFMWRVMGINEDGSVRLITEENVTAIPWGNDATAEQYDTSYINDWLNNYFYPKLKDKNLLVNQAWCSEIATDKTSTRTTCSTNLSKVAKPVGLITLDEYNLAGGALSYLNNSQQFWVLTPYNTWNVWSVRDDAAIYNYSVTDPYGARPVISISSDIIITGGNGTLTDPYMVEDKNIDITGNLKDNSHVGEYVTYAGRNYRVIETSTLGTKLILDGYYDANNDGTVNSGTDYFKYNENTTDGGCTLCTMINEDTFVNWITNNNSSDASKLVSTTWYRGANWGNYNTSYDYKINLSSTENPYTGKVGLIRVGEMLSGQSETILTKNHTVANSNFNAQYYWTGTPYSATNAWSVNDNGHANSNINMTRTRGVRPVIMISPSTVITSGNGTPNSPYQI